MKKQILMLVVILTSAVVGAAQKRPNVVWLVTEDNSACWYRLYHENGAPMPNVERLARDGLVFNHAYSCAPVCSAARSTIISGMYAPRTGAQYHRQQVRVEMPDGVRMFPWYLRQAGYYTSNNAKEDYNFERSAREDVWDESSRKATYRNRKSDQPFFHVQNYGLTHEGQLFKGLPKGEELQVDPDDIKLFPYHQDTPLMRQKYAEYLTRHTLVDAEMGELIDQLEAEGLLDDTFIFHYGDHGGVLPGSKGYIYNDGLQVAMVVYVPKNFRHLVPAERGSRIDGFVEFTDLSATVLNLAGIGIPDELDGRPFLGPGVKAAELNRRDTAFGYAERFDEKYDMVRTLHKGRYHYMRSYQPFNFDGLHAFYRYKQPAFVEWLELYKAGKLNAAQSRFFEARPPELLFDLEADPHEVHNLADDPAHAAVLGKMRTLLQQRVQSMPDSGFIPEPVLLRESGGDVYAYTLKHQALISRLIETADLQLLPFEQVRPKLQKALASDEPLIRYWALVVCSAFGQEAAAFYPTAEKLATSDPDRLVRMRAAEFLGLTEQQNPMPLLTELLRETKDPIEANLILNTVVLLRDGQPGYAFDVSKVMDEPWADKKGTQAERRLKYLKN